MRQRLSSILPASKGGKWDTFSTPLTVKLHSVELGLLYWTSIIAVFFYVVVIQFYVNHGYLLFTPAVNSVRMTLQEPTARCDPNYNTCADDYSNFSSLGYCCTDRCTPNNDDDHSCTCDTEKYGTVQALQCAHLDGADASIVMAGEMLVATSFRQVEQEMSPECTTNSSIVADSNACRKLWHGKQTWQAYVGDIERFTILLGHTLQVGAVSTPAAMMRGGKLEVVCGPDGCSKGQKLLCSNHPQASTSPIAGDLFCRTNPDAEGCSSEDIAAWLTNSTPCFVPPTGSARGNDFFRLQLFLGAMGLSLHNETARGQSYRFTGMVINLAIVYSNIKQFGVGTAPTWYVYRATMISDAYQQTQVIQNTGLTRLRRSTRGVLFNVEAQGTLGAYNVHATLVSVATGSTLLGLATIGIKMVATNFLKDKEMFKAAMSKEKKVKGGRKNLREALITKDEVEDNYPTV